MLEHFFCAVATPSTPADLRAALDKAHQTGTAPVLTEEQDEILTQVAGVAPGLVEIFATAEARDAALGPCAPYADVVAANPTELVNAGIGMADVAVGHRIGEPHFEAVLDAKVDASLRVFAASTEPTTELVSGRVTYTINRTGRVIGASPVYGKLPSDAEIRATMAWLHRVCGPRLIAAKADAGREIDEWSSAHGD